MKILTLAPPGSPEWLAARAGKIGGTAATNIICGADPTLRTFGTPLTEWLRLTGREEGDKLDTADAELARILRWGRESEPLHRQLLEQDTGGITEGPTGVVQDADHEWLACSPDGFMLFPDCSPAVLELKAPTRWTEREWEEGAPLPYQVQAAVAMRVLRVELAVVSALIPPAPRWAKITRSPAFEQFMLEQLGRFLDHHVRRDIPPEATGKHIDRLALARLHPRDNGQSIALPEDFEAVFARLEALDAEQKQASAEADALKARLIQALGDNTEGVCGPFRATHKWTSRAEHTVRASEFRTLRRTRR